ncbi:hypothetical protein FEM48_Zijuj05G0158100 [Ziziphus jujuba var. spinosa]|uniref:Uncharacterized protein n=1 Tax=Ziziphus jujuba var. spinosa TaxID=714518 RepID=A0A978VFQ1_ZIZJJ|nr:hypothetical protein FEM48_Zijuj05G0158100 [Ziziphus jujuba var. spinosa]
MGGRRVKLPLPVSQNLQNSSGNMRSRRQLEREEENSKRKRQEDDVSLHIEGRSYRIEPNNHDTESEKNEKKSQDPDTMAGPPVQNSEELQKREEDSSEKTSHEDVSDSEGEDHDSDMGGLRVQLTVSDMHQRQCQWEEGTSHRREEEEDVSDSAKESEESDTIGGPRVKIPLPDSQNLQDWSENIHHTMLRQRQSEREEEASKKRRQEYVSLHIEDRSSRVEVNDTESEDESDNFKMESSNGSNSENEDSDSDSKSQHSDNEDTDSDSKSQD